MTLKWVIAGAVVLVLIAVMLQPRVIYVGPPGAPLVTVIAGVHGNEPAPARYLEELARMQSAPPNVQFAFVQANPAALLFGVRGIGGDMNREWDRPSKLRRLVDRSQLVIDMHEAWGFERVSPGSLGQTMYTADAGLEPLVDQAVARLNRDIPDVAHQWQRLDALPALTDGTSLDMYCARLKKPYVLIEFAGQRDIQPPERRRAQCATALQVLLGIP